MTPEGNNLKAEMRRSREDIEEAQAALRQLQPQTELGRRLIELALKGIEDGVEPISADEVRDYLGRERYEDVS